jgi:type II secretory ATPase GspE/PulE/Tfp pilus assembly ATPase PilB-like protein
LVRVLCDKCKIPYAADLDELRKLGYEGATEPLTLYRAGECAYCGHTGFLGRVGIFEFMEMEEGIRRAIVSHADASTLRTAARERGMRSLREDGWLKIASGQTTVEEVMRVTQEV